MRLKEKAQKIKVKEVGKLQCQVKNLEHALSVKQAITEAIVKKLSMRNDRFKKERIKAKEIELKCNLPEETCTTSRRK